MSQPDRRQASAVVRVLSPLRDFLRTESSGAILLAAAAAIALAWVNLPGGHSYESFWTTRATLQIGDVSISLDLRHWINEGLMTIFFLVVGLEIKRELTDGHLSSRRAALLPAAAALGGMVAPALIYLAVAGRSVPSGWAIPIATDIALAIGVLAAVGTRAPTSLRSFLLGLAIVDDIGAIIIIAVVYSDHVSPWWLLAAMVPLSIVLIARHLRVYWTPLYVAIGIALWLCLYEGGIHATIAGVAMGLLAPSAPHLRRELIDEDALLDLSGVEAARETSDLARDSVSMVEWLQYALHPWTSYLIVPLFALANAGIPLSVDRIRDAANSALAWGIVLGLIVGKPLGVVVTTRVLTRIGIADPPTDAHPRSILGVGVAAGIGFTVALFITELALDDPVERSNATIAILIASIIAAVTSTFILRSSRPVDEDDPGVPAASVSAPTCP